jgi:hypothetical protein
MRPDRPIATLQQVFPYELQANRATFEVQLDDNSRICFLPLSAGGVALQVWRAGMAKDGHGFLLSGSAFLSETDVDVLINSLALQRKVA